MDSTNVINLYEKLLDLESSNHNTFIIALLSIVAILLGATWWWNKSGATKTIKNEVSLQFNKELKDFKKNINQQVQKDIKREIKKYQNAIIGIQGENSRAMAILASKDGKYSVSITWWARALKYAIDSNSDGSLIRMIVDAIITNLNNLKASDNESGNKKVTVYQYDSIVTIVEKIPNTLEKEKKQIVDGLKGRKDLDEN